MDRPATTVASPEKVEDESKKEKSDKCKKKRKRSEPSNNAVEVVDTEPRVWTSPNGVVVEELVRGNPDGKIAFPGKKVSSIFFSVLPELCKMVAELEFLFVTMIASQCPYPFNH